MGNIAFEIALVCYLAASLGYFVHFVYRKHWVSVMARIMVMVGLLSHTVHMGIRSSITGHGPYTTSFEVALFSAWVILIVYFLIELKYSIKNLGTFVVPLVFLILFVAMFLSKEASGVTATETEFWLTMHRGLSILGYAAFSIAFAAGIMYLIQEHQLKSKKLGPMYFRMPSLELLDDLNLKVITVGFPLFTMGFITGALTHLNVGASIFAWDMKKTWPLMAVWIIYSCVFFGRFAIGLRGKKAAQGAIIGFFAVILTYFLHV